jgi:hypothetical protein
MHTHTHTYTNTNSHTHIHTRARARSLSHTEDAIGQVQNWLQQLGVGDEVRERMRKEGMDIAAVSVATHQVCAVNVCVYVCVCVCVCVRSRVSRRDSGCVRERARAGRAGIDGARERKRERARESD